MAYGKEEFKEDVRDVAKEGAKVLVAGLIMFLLSAIRTDKRDEDSSCVINTLW